MRKNKDVINTAVVSLVGGLCSRKQEVGRVIDSWLGVVVSCVEGGEGELEGASWDLGLDGAADGEAGAPGHLEPLLLGLGDPVHRGHRDVWLNQQVCKHTEMMTHSPSIQQNGSWKGSDVTSLTCGNKLRAE